IDTRLITEANRMDIQRVGTYLIPSERWDAVEHYPDNGIGIGRLAVEESGVESKSASSVPNRPGARRGPAGGLPRAPDGPGRLAVVRPVRPKGRTAVFG